MKARIELDDQQANPPITFPCFMRLRSYPGTVVLFLAPQRGVRLAHNSKDEFEMMEEHDFAEFNRYEWQPFTGRLILDVEEGK
jgi:hypothetical protein